MNITDLRPEVLAFAFEMERKLRLGDLKYGGQTWKGKQPVVILPWIRAEEMELRAALATGEPGDVAAEAADVANFALMIADVAGELDLDHAKEALAIQNDIKTLLPILYREP